jgi:radial spoke head protein 4/6
VTLRCNRWPGAYVVAYNDKFANLYVGDGLKELGNPVRHFVPPKLPEIQMEFTVNENGPDLLVEQLDPTTEQEMIYENEQKAKDDDGKEGNGSDAEEEEEAEEDDA